jgi:group I intron endonuclease
LKSIEKYGVSNFKVDKLFDIAFSKEELDIKEYIWINYFDCVNNGYNWEEGGSHGKPSNETKAKISKILKQKYNNGEMIAPMKGKHHSKEAKLKIGKYNKGKVLSKETKIKISETHKGENSYLFGKTGKLHNSYGKTHSDMAKIKMKENHANFKRGNHPLSKKIICITTGRLFECIVDGAEYYNIKAKSHITSCCQGKRHYCGKLLDGTPLKWMYYDDYIKQQSIHNKNLEQAI